MKTVEQIIKSHGGLEALKENYIRIENEPYMRLCIEYVGQGPRNRPLISVAHYGEQNGDPRRDPDGGVELEGIPATGVADVYLWRWDPISYRNDYLGVDEIA